MLRLASEMAAKASVIADSVKSSCKTLTLDRVGNQNCRVGASQQSSDHIHAPCFPFGRLRLFRGMRRVRSGLRLNHSGVRQLKL